MKKHLAWLVPTSLLLIVCCGAPVAYIRYQQWEWKRTHREDLILGRSREDIVEKYGEPGSALQDSNDNSKETLIYYGPWGTAIRVYLENGTATKVEEHIYH